MSVVFFLILYFLPTFIVLLNGAKTSKAPVIIVNLFLGWTFIGWVIALAAAVSKDK